MSKQLTQEQRDRKNEKLRLARAAAKAAPVAAVPVQVAASGKPTPAKKKPAAVPAKKVAPARKVGSGGARAGAGKPLADKDKMVVISFRGTPAQKKKFAKLGGGEWARARVEAGTVKVGAK